MNIFSTSMTGRNIDEIAIVSLKDGKVLNRLELTPAFDRALVYICDNTLAIRPLADDEILISSQGYSECKKII